MSVKRETERSQRNRQSRETRVVWPKLYCLKSNPGRLLAWPAATLDICSISPHVPLLCGGFLALEMT